ncbi:hypothetical protein P8452_22476 [Trifolium repens]|nr:hypothetical protein P8452_22476 [Trifolium repens]
MNLRNKAAEVPLGCYLASVWSSHCVYNLSMWITYSLSHRKTIYLYTKGKKKLKCFRHKESIAANYGWRLNEDKQIDVRKLNTTR